MSEPGEFRSPVKILLPKTREGGVWILGGCFPSEDLYSMFQMVFSYFVCSLCGIHVVKMNNLHRKNSFLVRNNYFCSEFPLRQMKVLLNLLRRIFQVSKIKSLLNIVTEV